MRRDGTETGQPQDDPPAGARVSLWRNRDYVGWWTGHGLSALGTSVSNIAFPLLILYATGSVARAGVITAATMVGTLATTLLGGALADRVSRRLILITGPLVQAAALGAVAYAVHRGDAAVWLLSALACVAGAASGITSGSTIPSLRRIVPKEQIGEATARSMGRDMAARVIGAPLGGLLFSAARWAPFLADAVSFLFASLGAALIRRPLGPDREPGAERPGIGQDVVAGYRFVRDHAYLRFTVIWVALLNAVAQGFFLLLIALVKHRGGDPQTIGFVNATALVGGVVGAVIGPVLLARVRARTALLVSAWVFVESFAVVALVPEPWQIGAVLLVATAAMVPLNVILETYEVRLVPDEYSGRVSAVSRFGMQALQWTGPLAAGFLGDQFGVQGAVLFLMVLMAALAVTLHLTRSLRVLDEPVDAVEELPVPEARAGAGV
ncbi:MFS transporter [Streptomyces sp. NBC_00209]|uniref:MFS transporter n=1 Tax=Streptomyces sp. NBC_00209 TaxID=2975682 RepID=UPI0032491278